jgi:hypothetical protein
MSVSRKMWNSSPSSSSWKNIFIVNYNNKSGLGCGTLIQIWIKDAKRKLVQWGFKLKDFTEKKLKNFLIKNYNFYLSLGLHWGTLRYRRRLQLSKESIQHFKKCNYKLFSISVGHFCPPDPKPWIVQWGIWPWLRRTLGGGPCPRHWRPPEGRSRFLSYNSEKEKELSVNKQTKILPGYTNSQTGWDWK